MARIFKTNLTGLFVMIRAIDGLRARRELHEEANGGKFSMSENPVRVEDLPLTRLG
jgi:hypothetical protein